jgi:hypothetical protein
LAFVTDKYDKADGYEAEVISPPGLGSRAVK